VHAFISWFDVHFDHCHVPIKLSTSPFSNDTHWKSIIMYLEDPLPVFKNDLLYGSIAIQKCKKNFRDLNIKLSMHLNNEIG